MTTVQRAELFPAGTTVKVFALPSPLPGEYLRQAGDPTGWVPAMAAPAEPVVAEDGSLKVATADGVKSYLLAAQVEGEWRRLQLANNAGPSVITLTRQQIQTALTPQGGSSPSLGLGSSSSVSSGEGANVFFGPDALESLTTGRRNTAVGYNALPFLTTGNENTAIGNGAGDSNVTGSGNTFLGWNAGFEGTAGSHNTYVGRSAGEHAAGSENVFIGYECGSLTEGDKQLRIGIGSGDANYLIHGDFGAKTIGFLGAEGTKRIKLPAAATDLASAIALSNALRTMLIGFGLAE